ncbi:hypothetical protein [Sphingobacterium hungaricum]|uniref:Uncharacterized protein n=1 Tax=Sphingobacterium hungaricum TaxID=2082723 RepID=A0A928UTF7_9SPHI|nr:hypothetical protein [Sphingobacterium hungaricum]MBE8712417.1 hypothetical protein [Sphingobacterium hungaricum]
MDLKVKNALEAGLLAYAKEEGIDGKAFFSTLENIYDTEAPFMDKVSLLDEAFDTNQQFEELREVAFDLLMINFFSEDIQKLEEDYLDSEEWESIEDQTLDRGTELLNVFLYLRECADEEVNPSLDDFLKEFLLVEDDEFQDEHRIYEKVIANQILIESDYAEIAKTAKTLDIEDELADVFYPIMSFFTEPNPSSEKLTDFSASALNKSYDNAIYQLIINFNK